jgi:hypothetical protein
MHGECGQRGYDEGYDAVEVGVAHIRSGAEGLEVSIGSPEQGEQVEKGVEEVLRPRWSSLTPKGWGKGDSVMLWHRCQSLLCCIPVLRAVADFSLLLQQQYE